MLLESVEEWFLELAKSDPGSADQVEHAIDLLAEHGPTLGRPLVDSLAHARLHNLKELRPGSAGSGEIRIVFAFDPFRQAVFLVAGDKSGQWAAWYRSAVPLAEQRYAEYLEQEKRRRQESGGMGE